jgi:hypothetical protein
MANFAAWPRTGISTARAGPQAFFSKSPLFPSLTKADPDWMGIKRTIREPGLDPNPGPTGMMR